MKYTPATALAIKRDVQKAQETLALILQEIEERREEKLAIDAVLDDKRSLLVRFEDMMVGVFSRGLSERQEKEKYLAKLTQTIVNLETARDLLDAEVSLRKSEVKEPDGAVLMQSLIMQLQPMLEKLLNNIEISEEESLSLEAKKVEFKKANEQLALESKVYQQRVEDAKTVLDEINEKRKQALIELAREQQQLGIIRSRERDSGAMHKRLSDEYQKVYATVPRRGTK